MRHTGVLGINWDSISSVPTEHVWIVCGTIVALAVIAAVCVIVCHLN